MSAPLTPQTATADVLGRLADVIESRKGGDPDKSYVARLFHKGTDAVLKKVGEEAVETVMAAKDMAAAPTEARRKAFLRKWRLKCRAVADSLEEAGDRLFNFTRLPPSQWKSARTTNAVERLHEEFRRRIKTQTVLPEAETAPMLFWALLASGQIVMRKVDGWQTLVEPLSATPIDLAA